jgi:hypothetical protein
MPSRSDPHLTGSLPADIVGLHRLDVADLVRADPDVPSCRGGRELRDPLERRRVANDPSIAVAVVELSTVAPGDPGRVAVERRTRRTGPFPMT